MSTWHKTPSRLARLKLDLSELLSSSYPGVSIHFDDSNMYQFCLHLSPDSGPYKGLRLHFDVTLPQEWPAQPPRVRSTARIGHPNIFGSFICCDLLEEPRRVGYTGGYSPALTLSGLFMQFLTFFSSTKVEQETGDWISLGEAWETVPAEGEQPKEITRRNCRWESTRMTCSLARCSKCGYGTSISHIVDVQSSRTDKNASGSHSSPPYMTPPARCALSVLNDDVLYELLSILPSEVLLSFSSAYPRAHHLMNETHILILCELRCFFLRQPLSDCILGIGVHLNVGACSLSSDFDWLSEYAFTTFGVRRSIRKQPFEYFLPLAFSRAHFSRAQDSIWNHLMKIDNELQSAAESRKYNTRVPRSQPFQSARILYTFMNNIIVGLMQSADTVMEKQPSENQPDFQYRRGVQTHLLLASERAVISYCQLYHLLSSLAGARRELLREATNDLRKFITNPASRSKKHVSDMGEMIVKASLVLGLPPVDGGERLTWRHHLNGPLLQEVFVRNVKWTFKDHPELEVMEKGVSDYRLEKTFHSARTALRLTMFQVAFLSTFVAAHVEAPSRLSDTYGFPVRANPTDTPIEQQMVETIKSIYAVRTWPEFFEKVQFPGGLAWGKSKFSQVLRDCVSKSQAVGYHTPNQHKMALEDLRRKKENAWKISKS